MTQRQEERLESNRQRRTREARYDFKYFCLTYFSDNFYTKACPMHDDLFALMQEAILNGKADDIADAAPRGSAKSTIISFALPIWCAVYKKKNFIIITSDTADQADDFLTNIRLELEDNELLIDDFGELVGVTWSSSKLVLKNGVRLQAFGAGKKIRGRRYRQYRPDLIICDDLENDENIASVDQRKKMFDWYMKALSKAGDERTDKIVIGTLMHYDSLLSKLLNNPIYKTKKYQSVINWSTSPKWDDWELIITDLENKNRVKDARGFFNTNKEEMLRGTKVLWPEREDYYNLMVQRVADGPAAFSSEKQNEPLSDDERRFNPEWIRYYDDDELTGKNLFVVGACDPSMGKKGGDYSAIVSLGVDPNQIIYVLGANIERRHPDIIIEDVIEEYRKYHHRTFGVEDNAFQEYFKDTMQHRLQQSDVKGLGINIKGIKSHSDKILRIQSLQPAIKNGRIRFRRDQQRLVEQLINFPMADHDDGPDALELATSLLRAGSGFLEYYRDKADESKKKTAISFLQNPNLQRIG